MSAAILLAAACFWQVPDDLPLPETKTVYLRGDFELHPGERLRLDGAFPHARQFGINVHALPSNAALASVADTALPAQAGHGNPFLPGARRDRRDRRWVLEIAPAGPAGLRAGILGLGMGHEAPFKGRLLMRIYLPDAAYPGGGVAMPSVRKLSARGQWERLGGDCPSTSDLPRPQRPGPTRLPEAPGDVTDPIDWRGSATPAGTSQADLLINRDNAYAYAMIDLRRGDVLMLEGRAPRSPRTRDGARTAETGDVRYWSICAYIHPSNRTAACLADEDVPIDRRGMYRIVVAPAERRPGNATASCGMAFLSAPGAGEGLLLLRHVAPAPDFPHTPLHVPAGEDASAVLGAFEPVGRYRSTREVEGLGCPARGSR